MECWIFSKAFARRLISADSCNGKRKHRSDGCFALSVSCHDGLLLWVDPGFSSGVTGVVEIPPPSVARWLLLACRALDWADLPWFDTGTLINDLYRGDSSKCLLTAGWLFLAQTRANRLAVWGEHTQSLLKEKHKVAVSEGWEPRANSTLHVLTKKSGVRYTGWPSVPVTPNPSYTSWFVLEDTCSQFYSSRLHISRL